MSGGPEYALRLREVEAENARLRSAAQALIDSKIRRTAKGDPTVDAIAFARLARLLASTPGEP
jgi:hypothetical protein